MASDQEFLFHVDVMGELLRGKLLERLRRLERAGLLHPTREFDDPEALDRLLARLAKVRWVVYAKHPFRRIEHVLAYLGRYTHRVAISNGRLLEVTPSSVTFRTKEGKTHTVTLVEFLRRFLRHVLPDGFHKIRHYGLYASSSAGELEQARTCVENLGASAPIGRPPRPTWQELLRELTGRDVERCQRCGGPIERIPLEAHPARGPPSREAA